MKTTYPWMFIGALKFVLSAPDISTSDKALQMIDAEHNLFQKQRDNNLAGQGLSDRMKNEAPSANTFDAVAMTIQEYRMWNKKLLATVHYNCDVGGRQSEEFMWSASWSREHNKVTVKELKNIEYWDPEVEYDRHSHPPYFDAQWHHTARCFRHGNHACQNTFNGWIEGWIVQGKGLLMLQVKPEDDNVGKKQPYVLQSCILYHPGGPFCKIPEGHRATYCPIEGIDVELVE